VTAPVPATLVDLRLARAGFDADARAAMLVAAARILREEGPAALTVRRVAERVNASTKVIYTRFGGKDGLLDALYIHAFEGLGIVLSQCVEVAEPEPRLRRMCTAYRRYALAEPALYNIMFGDLGRAYEAPVASRRQAWRTFHALRDTVAACLPAARAGEADEITRLLWSAMHGVVGLELRGVLGDAAACEALFAAAIDAVFVARWLGRHAA
jgi:AcrR family transcriptional regulator